MSLASIAFLQPIHAQNISIDKNATLIVNFNSSKFSGYQGGPFVPSHDGSMYAYSTSIIDPKSHNWKSSLWLYFLKNDTTRSLDLNSDLSQISYLSFSADDKKLSFVGNGCDSDPSHTTFFVFNLLDIHLKCNGLTNVHDADWMPDGSIVFLENNEENDTISIYQNDTQKLLYVKQITPPYVSLNSSHIESIKASPDGKKIALWYFVMLSHKTQILNVDDGKITDTFDGGHPRWSKDGNMLLYTLPVGTGYYHDGPRSVITYINLLDVNKNKTTTIDSVPVGVDDLFLSTNGSKVFYVTKVPSVYDFLNFTSGIYEIDLNHEDNHILGGGPRFYNFSTTGGTPLHQFKSGVAADDVICRPDMQLLIQNQENLPICAKLGSVSNLLHRNWSYPTGCKYVHGPFTAGVESLVMIEKNASNPSSGKSYSPKNSTVVIGWNNTVSWINQDITPSSVTSDWNLFDSGPILPGADWQHNFECAGNYGYHSDPHPWMKGWIRVLPPSG